MNENPNEGEDELGGGDEGPCYQWQRQEFMLEGARLKDKIGNKKLININNKISKQLYDNVIVIQNLT